MNVKRYYFHKSLPQLIFDKTLDKNFGDKNEKKKKYFQKNSNIDNGTRSNEMNVKQNFTCTKLNK